MEVLAIIGRPNVGKSALFNRLTGKPRAIVEDRPGVTRDRLFGRVEWGEKHFWAVDTGGFDPAEGGSEDFAPEVIKEAMRKQVKLAVLQSTRAVLVVDGKAGLHPLDEAAAKLLRGYGRPVVLAVNKCDSREEESGQYDFAKLGFEKVVALSALHGYGVDELLDAACEGMASRETPPEDGRLRIAIVGRPNVGKSSILNAMLGEERQIVSDIPGTTRDAIDTPLKAHGRDLLLVDTAGIRHRGKIDDDVERYSSLRSLRAIEECDVALLVLDAMEGINMQDERIAGLIEEAGKACVIVVNKWDLPHKEIGTYEKCLEDVRKKLKFIDWAPVAFVSAKSHQRLGDLLPLAIEVGASHETRVTTAKLNRVLEEILAEQPLPSRHGKVLKILYMAQTGVKPPAFALFVNDPKLLHFSTERRIKKGLRERLKLEGTPVILMLRKRG